MPLIDPMSEEQSDAVADAPGHRCIRRSWPSRGRARLRSMPTGADLTPEAQDEQCEVEIGLLSAAEEINHLTDEARRKRIKIDLQWRTTGRLTSSRRSWSHAAVRATRAVPGEKIDGGGAAAVAGAMMHRRAYEGDDEAAL